MTTAVLYARYSTDMQSATSAEDQMRLLRQRAVREGWTIVAEHADAAISGSVRNRPGVQACLAAIAKGKATILLAESLDRISRDQEDIAAFHKRVRFAGAKIVTLSEGEIGVIHVGMTGTVAALQLEQTAEKVRRGQIGRVEAGRIPGSLSYGYTKVIALDARGEPERGLREVREDQADVIREIFARYADGESPLLIAKDLNVRGIAAPRGGLWRANAITGHRQRGNGLLHNTLYIGQVTYNRQTFRKDPDTRKRVSRPNDSSAHVTADLPHLRIIDQDLWDRVQARLASYEGMATGKARRPKRLLSGLLTCGVCGGSYVASGKDRWGCSDHRQTGTCTNGVTIFDSEAQRRLWKALRDDLLHPDVIAEYLAEMRRLEAEHRHDKIKARAECERRLAEIRADEDRIVDAIVSGLPIEPLRARAEALAAERETLTAQLAEMPLPATAVVHPASIEHYRRRVASLHQLADADDSIRPLARALLVELIQKIEVTPRQNGKRGADLTIHGQLAALLAIQTQKSPTGDGEAERMLAMVAGVGFEPTTFRL